MFEIGSVVLEKFGFEKNDSSKTVQLFKQLCISFLDTKFEAKIILAKPFKSAFELRLFIVSIRMLFRAL